MTDRQISEVKANPWRDLKQFTAARIAVGRVGASLPTDELLRFGLAHAMARDAVHLPLSVPKLAADLAHCGFESCVVDSRAPDRATYLLRPDLGRELNAESCADIAKLRSGCDLAVVVGDGLSAIAVQRHALPLLRAFSAFAKHGWNLAPVIIARHARVALGDAIGELLRARLVIMLIGERPGLSSPDSLGAYLTYLPRIGRTDAERNCISNIRPEGLPYEAAARKLLWLTEASLRLALTGVALKDESDLTLIEG
ncbi:MAG: ethanolamine ammonia-lyase subunit EutC [Gammaproteobacteria bacterium]|nr:ethanolamine ammonia-lyase subunit EutC [Gammaproteobacteria bacterium]